MLKSPKCLLVLGLIGMLVTRSATPADADYYVKVKNAGRMEIKSVFLSAPNDDEWGQDRLANDTLRPGYVLSVRLDDGRCYYDVLAVYADDVKQKYDNVNTCNGNDIVFRR